MPGAPNGRLRVTPYTTGRIATPTQPIVPSDYDNAAAESDILWRWNGTDVSQFTSGACKAGTPSFGTLDSTATAFDDTSGQGSLVKFSAASAGGVVTSTLWQINDCPELPQRFVVEFRYAGGVVPGGSNVYAGFFCHNNDAADLWGFGMGHQPASTSPIYGYADGALSTGTYPPFTPNQSSGNLNASDSTSAPFFGALYEVVFLQQTASGGNTPLPTIFPHCKGAVSANVTVDRATSAGLIGSPASSGFNDRNDMRYVGVQLTFAGLTGSTDIYFSEMIIRKYPWDRT